MLQPDPHRASTSIGAVDFSVSPPMAVRTFGAGTRTECWWGESPGARECWWGPLHKRSPVCMSVCGVLGGGVSSPQQVWGFRLALSLREPQRGQVPVRGPSGSRPPTSAPSNPEAEAPHPLRHGVASLAQQGPAGTKEGGGLGQAWPGQVPHGAG